MARGLNKAMLIGHLGRDPEVRYMPSGGAVANVTIATSERWKDRQSGDQQERTEWHRVVFFGRLAEIASEYLKKGTMVYIEGRIQTRKWQDQSGQDRYTTEIVANDMQMLSSRGGAAPSDDHEEFSSAPPAEPTQRQAPASAAGAGVADDFDDDIPF